MNAPWANDVESDREDFSKRGGTVHRAPLNHSFCEATFLYGSQAMHFAAFCNRRSPVERGGAHCRVRRRHGRTGPTRPQGEGNDVAPLSAGVREAAAAKFPFGYLGNQGRQRARADLYVNTVKKQETNYTVCERRVQIRPSSVRKYVKNALRVMF